MPQKCTWNTAVASAAHMLCCRLTQPCGSLRLPQTAHGHEPWTAPFPCMTACVFSGQAAQPRARTSPDAGQGPYLLPAGCSTNEDQRPLPSGACMRASTCSRPTLEPSGSCKRGSNTDDVNQVLNKAGDEVLLQACGIGAQRGAARQTRTAEEGGPAQGPGAQDRLAGCSSPSKHNCRSLSHSI